jgi:hypothetical protein
VSEYSWPDWDTGSQEAFRAAWPATLSALPLGTRVTGEVIGRQPFGVFLRFDEVPDAIGLAEILAAPADAALPEVGTKVSGEVIWHTEHNHQVKIRLTAWEARPQNSAPSPALSTPASPTSSDGS